MRRALTPRPFRRQPGLVVVGILCLVIVGSCAFANPGPPPSSPGNSASGAPTCGDQPLSCEQLVALGLSYPYPREPGSYLFVEGVAYPYVNLRHHSLADASVRAGGTVVSARSLLERLGLRSQADEPRSPVIAYGSNANVDALTRKFVTSGYPDPAVIPVVKATLRGFDVAWAPQFVSNGAMPATLVPSMGTSVVVWITWLDHDELDQMNATEGVGTLYSYGLLRGARLDASGPPAIRPGLYVDCAGALKVDGRILAIDGVSATHRRFTALDSLAALRKVAVAIGWRGSVFGLVLDNVRSPEDRAKREKVLEALAAKPPLPGYTATRGCAET